MADKQRLKNLDPITDEFITNLVLKADLTPSAES